MLCLYRLKSNENKFGIWSFGIPRSSQASTPSSLPSQPFRPVAQDEPSLVLMMKWMLCGAKHCVRELCRECGM